jgi:NitT/TauT family transport system substrate-binding protein
MKSIFAAAALASCLIGIAQAKEETGSPLSVNLSLGDVSLNKVAFLVAADNGIYEKNGLKVRQFVTADAASRIKRSGVAVPADFIGTEEEEAAAPLNIGGGSPLIVRMTSDARAVNRVILLTFEDTSKFHIISKKEINSIDDLKGRRLGYSVYGAVSHLMALALLKQKGWSQEDDISLIGEGMAYDALKRDKVDAFIGSEIYYGMAEKQGFKDLADITPLNIPVAGSGLNAEREWLKKNRETAQRMVKSSIDAYAFMKKNKEATLKAMEKWFGVKDRAQQESMYRTVEATPWKPYPSVSGIKAVMSLYTYRELKKAKPEDFYDASFIIELDKSGYIDALYRGESMGLK